MANRRTPPVPTPPAATPVANTEPDAAAAKPVFDWATLPAPVAMPSTLTPGNIKVDVIKTVPEPIRVRAEACLAINTERVKAKADSNATRPRIDYYWALQQVTDAPMGAEFVKLLTKYAKYRPAEGTIPHAEDASAAGQATARAGDPGHYRLDSEGKYVSCADGDDGAVFGVRYSVRPFEQRKDAARLPGTA